MKRRRRRRHADPFAAFRDIAPRVNPATPLEWEELPPSSPYKCKPYESRTLGRTIPGRGGGTVTACATPAPEHPKEGQVWIGLPVAGIGFPMRRYTANRRLREEGKRKVTDLEEASRSWYQNRDTYRETEAAADAARDAGTFLPLPPGVEFPYVEDKPPRCSPRHRLWRDLRKLIDEAPPFVDPSELAAEARAHPQAQEWEQQFGDCMRAWRKRIERKAPKTGIESTGRQAARRRTTARARGEDTSAAEYTDLLTKAARKAARAGGRRRRR